jgi:hypothetical protein
MLGKRRRVIRKVFAETEPTRCRPGIAEQAVFDRVNKVNGRGRRK